MGNLLTIQGQRPPRIEMTVDVDPAVYGELSVFTLRKPNNTSATINSFTDANGNAIATFNLKRKDPVGMYFGSVEVTVGNEVITASDSLLV